MVKDFFIVNTFTNESNSINNDITTPVAVFICQEFHSLQTMQNISMEINTKESIFIHKKDNSDVKRNVFDAICFSSNKQISTHCCGLFAAAKVINSLNPKTKEININVNNNNYNVQVKPNNNVLVTFCIINDFSDIKRIFNLHYINLLFSRENIIAINRYNNTLIIETKYHNTLDILNNFNFVSLCNQILVDTVIITSRSNEYHYNYCAQFYSNKNNIDIMYNSIIVANYWHKKIKEIKLIGYFPQSKSYISTFTDSILFNIECKCIINSNGELLVENI